MFKFGNTQNEILTSHKEPDILMYETPEMY